ncbi:MAG: hypothetical protein ACXVDG_10685, partial [Tumebacillaceae bacterium]
MIAVVRTPKRKLLFITRDFSRNVDPWSHYFALAWAKHCLLSLWHAPGWIHEIVAQLPERP